MSLNLERPYFLFGILLFASNFLVITLSIINNDLYKMNESINYT